MLHRLRPLSSPTHSSLVVLLGAGQHLGKADNQCSKGCCPFGPRDQSRALFWMARIHLARCQPPVRRPGFGSGTRARKREDRYPARKNKLQRLTSNQMSISTLNTARAPARFPRTLQPARGPSTRSPAALTRGLSPGKLP